MKKIFVLALVVLSLVSCKKEPDYDEIIRGTWLCQETNIYVVPTDRARVLRFGDNSASAALGEDSVWTEHSGLSYSISGDELSISGQDYRENYTIVYANNSKLRLKNGTDTYNFYKETDDFTHLVSGTWTSADSLNAFTVDFNGKNFDYHNDTVSVSGTFALYGQLFVAMYDSRYSCFLLSEQKFDLIFTAYYAMTGMTNDLQARTYRLRK